MRKILVLLLILVCLPVYAQQLEAGIVDLKWEWLVPANLAYVDKVKTSMWDSDEERFLKEEYNYWANRRDKFDNLMNNCNLVSNIDAKKSCLVDIVQKQKEENCKHIQQINLKIANKRKWNKFSESMSDFVDNVNRTIKYQQFIDAVNSPKVIINNR